MSKFLTQILTGGLPSVTEGSHAYGTWQWWDEGILNFTPSRQTDRAMILSVGIHGNETAPVELLAPWIDDLLSGNVASAWRLLIIAGHPAALRAGKRYLHTDMNRLFGGRWRQFPASPETQRARRLELAVAQFWQANAVSCRWHLDMHTAIRDAVHTQFGVLPFRQRPYEADFLDWLAAAGLEALVFHQQPGGTFSHFTSEHFEASSCTLELGKARPFGENDLRHFLSARHALFSLLSGEPLALPQTKPIRYRVVGQIVRTSEHFRLNMADDVPNFTSFTRGTCVAEDEVSQTIVQHDKEYVLFPNPKVAPGMRAGLMLTIDHST